METLIYLILAFTFARMAAAYEDIMPVFGHTPTHYYDSPDRAFKTDT